MRLRLGEQAKFRDVEVTGLPDGGDDGSSADSLIAGNKRQVVKSCSGGDDAVRHHSCSVRQELLGHCHVTTTQIYDKRRRPAHEGASHDIPI
jgi:hypothetical protein